MHTYIHAYLHRLIHIHIHEYFTTYVFPWVATGGEVKERGGATGIDSRCSLNREMNGLKESQHAATRCNTLRIAATHCNTAQDIHQYATGCNTLQHAATCCNTAHDIQQYGELVQSLHAATCKLENVVKEFKQTATCCNTDREIHECSAPQKCEPELVTAHLGVYNTFAHARTFEAQGNKKIRNAATHCNKNHTEYQSSAMPKIEQEFGTPNIHTFEANMREQIRRLEMVVYTYMYI